MVLEQTLVQQWLDGYSWAGIQARKASLFRISRGFGSTRANEWLKNVLKKCIGLAAFDFGNIDHRITLGIGVVTQLRGEAG